MATRKTKALHTFTESALKGNCAASGRGFYDTFDVSAPGIWASGFERNPALSPMLMRSFDDFQERT